VPLTLEKFSSVIILGFQVSHLPNHANGISLMNIDTEEVRIKLKKPQFLVNVTKHDK